MRAKGITIPPSPLLSAANASLPTPILSPMNLSSMSSIPNPPPLPASFMSVQIRGDNYPVFSMAQQRPPNKSSGSFNEELFQYWQNFTARQYPGRANFDTPQEMNNRNSETMTTDGCAGSPRLMLAQAEDSSERQADPLHPDSIAQSNSQSKTLQETVIPSSQFLVTTNPYNPYNYYPGTSIAPFVTMAGPFATQSLEAGLLAMNSYAAVIPVTTLATSITTSETNSVKTVPTTRPQERQEQ